MTDADTMIDSGRVTIGKRFEFSAGHELRTLGSGHRCFGNHAHNYVVTMTVVVADALDELGFVTDFATLAPFGRYLAGAFDHRLLNDMVPDVRGAGGVSGSVVHRADRTGDLRAVGVDAGRADPAIGGDMAPGLSAALPCTGAGRRPGSEQVLAERFVSVLELGWNLSPCLYVLTGAR
ncbi:6-carboxytetrahydropterin synthase [Actinokineospora cianjurensis]|uniref:6-carboxy-5,6,7,8-tetrahydropterin synthase n=1 Tax=Actinokineospora cianjurensis TaxID=585224 RepID=A0A421B212_9PSEU|nr:6-carboxytetrahydropterin synthase [Actinokineospora cianjurensis]RLK58382.1 6-pyruvoyl tetrahydropterin synthase-like protein [Actinokineospora cianjurensis]